MFLNITRFLDINSMGLTLFFYGSPDMVLICVPNTWLAIILSETLGRPRGGGGQMRLVDKLISTRKLQAFRLSVY
jgi:hypothetical protein